MRLTVCVLQHAGCETPGTIAEVLQKQSLDIKIIRTFAGEPVPADLRSFAGLLLMGGPQSVYEQDQFPFLRDELRLIESALKAGKPILGVCLGSQLLAAALGACVYPGKRKEIGWFPVTLAPETAQDALWKETPSPFTAYHWHGDVFDLPAGASNLAASELTAHQAFRYGANAYGLLFHMEVTEALVAGMVHMFADELQTAGADAQAILDDTGKHLPMLQTIGGMVFQRWADLVSDR